MKGERASRRLASKWSVGLMAAALLLIVLVSISRGSQQTPGRSGKGLPLSQPGRGLIYDGLQRDPGGQCRSGFGVGTSDRCTHGPDPAPEGVDLAQTAAPVTNAAAAPKTQCDGDGGSGKRTQVLYVRSSDRADRFATYLESFRTWAGDGDRIYQNSAAKTGGVRQLRFVYDASCNVDVEQAVIPSRADDNLDNTIAALENLGFSRTDRKYMLFVDANIYCGIGTGFTDDRAGAENINNNGPSYGRMDAACWNGRLFAHEHMHVLGGVQLSAPHTSGAFHCTDTNDVMCYPDEPDRPPMQLLCPEVANEDLFDCNNDDYFNTSPAPGSYLATRWNVANSQYLSSSSPATTSVSEAPVSGTAADGQGPTGGDRRPPNRSDGLEGGPYSSSG